MIEQRPGHIMRTPPDKSRARAIADFPLAAPLLLLAGVCLAVVPWLHPNNTCKDWLMKWGQLAAHPFWLPIHQIATAGFALAAAAAAALSLLGRRSTLGLLAGGMLAPGLSIQCMLVLVHATAVSRLGEAFNAATTEPQRQTFRILAEAFVRYDVAASGVAAALISAGAVLMAWHLARVEALSPLTAVFFAGLGSVWGLQAHGAFRLLHIPTTEWIPYTSLALWMGGLGLLLLVRRGESVAEATRRDDRGYEQPLAQEP